MKQPRLIQGPFHPGFDCERMDHVCMTPGRCRTARGCLGIPTAVTNTNAGPEPLDPVQYKLRDEAWYAYRERHKLDTRYDRIAIAAMRDAFNGGYKTRKHFEMEAALGMRPTPVNWGDHSDY